VLFCKNLFYIKIVNVGGKCFYFKRFHYFCIFRLNVSLYISYFHDYYDRTGKSLTRTSDQTVESLHQVVDKIFHRSNYWVKDPTSKMHGRKMLDGVLHIKGYTATQMGLVPVASVSNM